jgi:hypothetical protein
MLLWIQLHICSPHSALDLHKEIELANSLPRPTFKEMWTSNERPNADGGERSFLPQFPGHGVQDALVIIIHAAAGNLPTAGHAIAGAALNEKDAGCGGIGVVEDEGPGCEVLVFRAWVVGGYVLIRGDREW